MAENILAAACESESRKAAKRMRMDVYQAHVSSVVEVYVVYTCETWSVILSLFILKPT